MWGHSRPVLRSGQALRNRRRLSRHKLPVPWRLRRPRVPQRGDLPPPARAEGRKSRLIELGPLSRSNHPDQRKPRKPADHPSLRVLRRVSAEVRLTERLEVLHRNLRLPESGGDHRREDLLCPRGTLAPDQDPRRSYYPAASLNY